MRNLVVLAIVGFVAAHGRVAGDGLQGDFYDVVAGDSGAYAGAGVDGGTSPR